MLNSIFSHNSSLFNIKAEADFNQMHSQVGKTIREYQPPPPGNASQVYILLMKGTYWKFYHTNPHNDYISRFAEGFHGYLSCDSVGHLFRAFPDKASTDIK